MRKNIKLTTDDFIIKSNIVHNNLYKYDKSVYINAKTKVVITCNQHGDFKQIPYSHFNGNGCPLCMSDNSSKNKRSDRSEVINKFNKKWNFKYNYELVEFINNLSKIKIICPEHGIFEQTLKSHFKYGCSSCANNNPFTCESFLERSKKIHDNKYTYCLPDQINSKTIIDIKCNSHGIFKQRINNHLHLRQGCPFCYESKGEWQIALYLKNNDIAFERQKKFENCVNFNKLSFDFYLPEYNTCIEFDGIQHFKPVDLFGGQESFNKLKVNDNIKEIFCSKNSIKLLRIRYKIDDVEKSLSDFLEKN